MKKFLPMSLMMFCVLFIYSLARNLKDTMIVNASGASAACISYLKVYGALPFAMLSVVVFSRMLEKFGSKKSFYFTISFFIFFYCIFGFLLHPLIPKIHASEDWVSNMQETSPKIFYDIWPLIGNWSVSLFYIVSEIWGGLVINSLFWQFANQITKKEEVKRFYSLFSCIGDVALIFSGFFTKLSIQFESFKVKIQMLGILVVGILLMYLYYYIHKKVLTDSKFYTPIEKPSITSKKKPKSFLKSFACIFKSKYLLLTSVLVIAYGVAINIFEVTWKEQGKLFYGSESKFNDMMANVSIATGILTIFITLVGGNILRKCKWRTAALVTPFSIFILGSVFFLLIIFENYNGINAKIFIFNVLELIVWIGLFQDAVSKSIKYSLFDSTKQMIYIPLNEELKTTGQMAIEVVIGRFGKSLGSIIIIMLRGVFGTTVPLRGMVNVLFPTLLVITGVWVFSVIKLSKKYENLKNKIKNKSKQVA
jgi:AAA family ATP:ADP antiporter